MGSTPKPPDPMQTATAQTQLNKDTAVAQYGLNATNQVTPYGNLSYKQIGTWQDGTPRFEATQTLSPEEQNLYNNYTSLAGKFGDIGNNQATNVASTLSQPFNFDAATATKLSNIQDTFLNPQFDRQNAMLETKLANQGVTPGSAAYNDAFKQQNLQQQDSRNSNYLSAYDAASRQALTERQEPLNELTSLLSGSQVQNPNFVNTPQAGVAPVDYTGLVQNNYQAQVGNQNALYGALGGIGGTLLGGWSYGGFKNPFAVK